MEHGATGLAVFTPIEPEHPLFFFNLRFTLNDIHPVFTEPCPCGMSGFRYKIVGRVVLDEPPHGWCLRWLSVKKNIVLLLLFCFPYSPLHPKT